MAAFPTDGTVASPCITARSPEPFVQHRVESKVFLPLSIPSRNLLLHCIILIFFFNWTMQQLLLCWKETCLWLLDVSVQSFFLFFLFHFSGIMIKERSSSLDILVLHAGCHFCHFASSRMTDTLLLSKQRLLINQSDVVLLTLNNLCIYWHIPEWKGKIKPVGFFF